MAVIGISRRSWQLAGSLLLAILAGTTGLAAAQSEALAAPDLSTVVLSTIPGMVAASPGPQNGPVDQASLQYLDASPGESSALLRQINNGDAVGYVRLWSREPPNGDGVIISALQFQSVGAANEWLLGQVASAKGSRGVSTFPAPSVPFGAGFTVPTQTSTGIPVTAHVVYFNEGDISFQVGVLSQSGDLGSSNAVTLANAQAAKVPASTATGSSSSGTNDSLPVRAGEIFAAVVAVLVIAWVISLLIRRRRKGSVQRPPTSVGARPGAVTGAYPAPPNAATEPGWVPSRTNMNEQFFWNGTEWAGRRYWRGSGLGWVEEEQPVPR